VNTRTGAILRDGPNIYKMLNSKHFFKLSAEHLLIFKKLGLVEDMVEANLEKFQMIFDQYFSRAGAVPIEKHVLASDMQKIIHRHGLNNLELRKWFDWLSRQYGVKNMRMRHTELNKNRAQSHHLRGGSSAEREFRAAGEKRAFMSLPSFLVSVFQLALMISQFLSRLAVLFALRHKLLQSPKVRHHRKRGNSLVTRDGPPRVFSSAQARILF
jgi:hypothetical protein